MKKALKVALMAASLFVLGGCSSMLDATYGLGMEKPADAPAGWASHREGLRFEREGKPKDAKLAFCNAAELGHPEGKTRCEQYTLLEATEIYFKKRDSRYAEIVVCSVKEYGPTAKALCEMGMQGQDIGSGIDALRAKLDVDAPKDGSSGCRAAAPAATEHGTGAQDSASARIRCQGPDRRPLDHVNRRPGEMGHQQCTAVGLEVPL